MIDSSIWAKKVCDAIETISDRDFQKKVWVKGEDLDKYFSSYVEAFCSLIDDSDFNNFLGSCWHKFNLSQLLHKKLIILKDALCNYSPKDQYNDKQIINDPEWIKITKLAKDALEQMKSEIGSGK